MKEWMVGPEALPYLEEKLSWGWTLARKMGSIDLAGGRVITYIPEDTDPAEAACFDGGRVRLMFATWDWVRAIVRRYLESAPGRCAVFETDWSPRFHSVSTETELRWFTYAGDLYSFAATSCCSEGIVREAWRASRHGPPVVAALSQMGAGDLCSWHGREVGEDMLDAIVAGVDHLMVGAYDGASVLLWTRPGAEVITGGGDPE